MAKAIGGGGGPSVTVEPLSVDKNGTTVAPAGKAYSPVNVNVPNTYSAGDEGKVVSNGALVEQTAHATVTENGTIDTTLNNSVVVDVPQGGGGGVASNAVNFRGYDGTIVASYSAADFAALTELPANPSHDGLTAQGWNWSLSDAQAYVAKYGRLEIGQMYITDDGKTRVYIHLEQGRTSPMLGCCPNGTVDVDWGDGTAHDTLTGASTTTVKWTPRHNYAEPGDYVIKLAVTGSMGFYGNNISNEYSGLLRYASGADSRNYAYQNAIKRVGIGSSVTSIGDNAFNTCYSLASVTIPDSLTSIASAVFYSCYSLASVTIPDSVTSIDTYVFGFCYGVAEYHLAPTTPPTIPNTNAFSGIAADCIIYVPYSADHSILEAYKSANNWSNYASKMQEEAA